MSHDLFKERLLLTCHLNEDHELQLGELFSFIDSASPFESLEILKRLDRLFKCKYDLEADVLRYTIQFEE